MADLSSPKRQHQILMAASRAQRSIRVFYLVLVLAFVAALSYLLVRVAMVVLEPREPAALVTRPVELTAEPAVPIAEFLVAADARWSVDDADGLSDAGFGVTRLHDAGRVRGEQLADTAGPIDAETLAKFRSLMAQAERALNEQFDYSTAVARFEQALAVPGVSRFEREQAEVGLDRALVFRTALRGVQPLSQTHRIVRYVPPGSEASEGVVGLVERSEPNWRGPGRIRVTRLGTTQASELPVTSNWRVDELIGDELAEAHARRVLSEMTRIRQLQERDVLSPTDLIGAAVAVFQTGDIRTPDGSLVVGKAQAHACLSQAYELCAAHGASLTETVLLRRDPLFADFVRRQPATFMLEHQVARAESTAERARLNERLEEELRRSRDVLRTLVRRYPRAWDFRALDDRDDVSAMLESLRAAAVADGQREAEVIRGNDVDEPDASTTASADVPERVRAFVEQGDAAMARGHELSRAERYREAVEQYFAARDSYRQAVALAPEAADIAEKLRIANSSISMTRRLAPTSR